MRITWHSLKAWPAGRTPTPALDRDTGGGFRSTFSTSLDKLEYELGRINAHDVAIDVDVAEKDMQRDGTPTARASIRSTPGVVLRFVRDGQTITMPCDKYKTWQRNIHALALTLEALRAVDRYGSTTSKGEQYRGFTALPAAGGSTITTTLGLGQSAELLQKWSGDKHHALTITRDIDAARAAYRIAKARSHPDALAYGGSHAEFALVNDAARVLAAHHGVERL